MILKLPWGVGAQVRPTPVSEGARRVATPVPESLLLRTR